MQAILIGATGLTGGILLEILLAHEQVASVITLSRKRVQNNHPKHTGYEVDLLNPATYREHLRGTHLFICTGTTQAKTADKKEYYRIEHDLPLTVAQTALDNEVGAVIAISALGASPDSSFAYNRGKGDMERDIAALGFKQCYFVQPALIGGDRTESRPMERFFIKAQRAVDPLMVGFLKKYRIIEPETIAAAMLYAALHGDKDMRIESDRLKELAALQQANDLA
jgi:uncharacterized protein YbjT (DUF2867 family)